MLQAVAEFEFDKRYWSRTMLYWKLKKAVPDPSILMFGCMRPRQKESRQIAEEKTTGSGVRPPPACKPADISCPRLKNPPNPKRFGW